MTLARWNRPTCKLVLCLIVLLPTVASVQADQRAPQQEEFPIDDTPGFSIMRTLADYDLHDLQDERWNVYGQGTFISQWHPAFPAAYTNLNGTPNSLLPQAQNAFTGTVTLYGSLKLWEGTELYGAPEMIAEQPFSQLKGLGGSIQNFEFQKNGTVQPTWYRSRAYVKQTFNLGGESSLLASGPLQLAQTINSRRVVVSFGDMSVLDVFDKNTFSGDLRQQFFNISFMSYGAYDFAADSRGYSVGLATEFYYDQWAYRFGRFVLPKNPNDLNLDFRAFKYYGDQIEVEHKHTLYGYAGAIRILGYHNHEDAGTFAGAMTAFNANPQQNAAACPGWNYGSPNANAPDVCWARKTTDKYGIGINLEQLIGDDVGTFFRAMYNDGRTEVYNYTSTDRSIALGTVFHGRLWDRHKDAIGIGWAQNMLSAKHVEYLQMGGIDQFIGDGAIHYRPEQVVDIYYKYHLLGSTWATADYQFINNPGYNADRGPLQVFGLRLHVDF